MEKKLTLSLDFDGTIVTAEYPKIGKVRNGAKEVITKWYNEGHTIIINSCRNGNMQKEMVIALVHNGIPFHYVNENSKALIDLYGGDTRKISADIYFDDKNPEGFKSWEWAESVVERKLWMKPNIICIVGESGCGKTFWAEYVESEYGIKMIQSYTDRAQRYEGENGHTYVTAEEFDSFKKEDMIAFTEFGGKRYCCLKKDVREMNTYVIDETGFIYLSDTFIDSYNIVSIRLVCDYKERLLRAGRERVDRDKDMFNLPMDFFDVCIDTSYPKEEVKKFVDMTISKLL